ncbi:uncharacterized protein LOC131285113 [Anopheles ziemanni]|uniref:uncharacterized protein LOC131263803 n=1 Tax=Anopheles coustani TaxID=139045 RepID=UPI002658F487|nr:uncharacterized protein LOC131263803 [Anopheles coustani]XP_058169955.1 uncharacterized protein LOC131285113 [Anopheles ziemanni]
MLKTSFLHRRVALDLIDLAPMFLLLLVPLAVLGNRPPAAVFEDVFELGRPNSAFLATAESRNGMKAYLRKKYRNLRDPVPQASTMAAYTAAHERYQNSEEKRNDRIRMENLRKLASIRTKRLDPQEQQQQQHHQLATGKKAKRIDIVPREVFKFELSDAMVFHPASKSQTADQEPEVRTKREAKRVEPVPREIIRFELADAIVASKKKVESLEPANGTAAAAHKRQRRSASPDPRDYVKFELEDAKSPQNYTAQARSAPKITENLRHPFTSSDSYKRGKVFDEVVERPEAGGRKTGRSRKEKRESISQLEPEQEELSDMSPEESRRVKVRGKKQKQVANYEDLPPGVQKAIDIAIKENERMNGKGRELGQDGLAVTPSTPKYFFGDKKPKTKKPYSGPTKITEPKFVPSAKISETKLPSIEEESNGQTGFIPSKAIGMGTSGPQLEAGDGGKTSSTLQGIPKAWWSYSDLRRPKRLYHKTPAQPLVISPQYVSTFKPAGESSSKMNDLSPGYHHRRPTLFAPVSTSGSGSSGSSNEHYAYEGHLSNGPEEVIIKERPKIQYVIKEIPVPVQMKQPRTKITVQPSISISYDKDITSPASGEGSSGRGYDNPYGPIELQYEHRQPPKEPAKSFQNMKIVVPDPKEESREQEQYYDHSSYNHGGGVESTQGPPAHSNEIDTTGSSIAALSALIGQRPSVQLKGLNELLQMPIAMGNHQQLQKQQQHHQQQQHYQHPQQRPQDSTAPVTFPESSTPTPKSSRPGYRSVQIEHGPKIVYDDSLYHTVQMNPQLQVPMSKEYTPIKEEVPDIADSDLIGPTVATPTHATYIIGSPKSTPAPIVEHHEFNEEEAGHETNSYRHINVHSTPATPLVESVSHHYQEQHHHHHHHHDAGDEHYDDSEGYAFGYRVRDFHTGNDFGHVQNHDNGVTRGEYHILLPDGRVQNVRYTADEKGFHADVTYESVHPAPHNRK